MEFKYILNENTFKALEKIDYESRTIFLKAYCMPNS